MTTRVSNSLFFAHQRAMQRGLNLHFSPRSFNGFSSSSSSMMIMEWKLWVIFAAARSKALEPIFLNIVRKLSFVTFFIYDYLIYNKQDWNKSMTAKRSLQLKTHNLQKIFDQTSHCAKFLEAASVWSFLTRYDQFRSCWPVEKRKQFGKIWKEG